jgi:hypothetical protein
MPFQVANFLFELLALLHELVSIASRSFGEKGQSITIEGGIVIIADVVYLHNIFLLSSKRYTKSIG